MGLRAYFVIDTVEGMDQQEFVKAVRETAQMPGVDFVDPLIGPPDMVVMVDAPITVQAIANRIKAKPWVKNIRVLRAVSIFERHVTTKVSKAPIFELAGVSSADLKTTYTPQSISIYELLGIAGEVMGSRAYFLIDTIDDMDQREFLKAVREIEETPGVDFVDPVIGPPDMMVMVDAPLSVQALAGEIGAKPWVKNMQVLPLVRLFEHRDIKVAKMPVFEPVGVSTADLEPAYAPQSVSIYKLLSITARAA